MGTGKKAIELAPPENNMPEIVTNSTENTYSSAAPHIVQVIASISTSRGGPSRSTVGLCENLAMAGCDVDLCTLNAGNRLGKDVPVNEKLVNIRRAPCNSRWAGLFAPSAFKRIVRQAATNADMVHCQGIWTPAAAFGARAATALGKPYIISLRGMLAPIALRRSVWKKRIASLAYVRRNLAQAGCLHALTEQELRDARSFGVRSPIALIPNGIATPSLESLPDKSKARKHFPDLPDKKLILFLGRIHPIKNLSALVQAWCTLARKFDDWRLVIAGPDEVGLQAELAAAAHDGGIGDRVVFMEAAYGRDKQMLLRAADIFCLPSHTEGLSMGLLEAMAYRLPVLVTRQCNFAEVETAGTGILVDKDPDSIREGLGTMLSLNEAKRNEMGANGRQLVEERFKWETVARNTVAVYHWILERGPKPDCVRVDESLGGDNVCE